MDDITFQKELSNSIENTIKWAKINYVLAHIVFTISIVSSFGGSLIIALGKDKILTVILAALPGLMLLINNTFRFEERAKWFWRKTRVSEAYSRELRDKSDPDTHLLSQNYSRELAELELEWPAFGSSPSQPQKDGIKH